MANRPENRVRFAIRTAGIGLALIHAAAHPAPYPGAEDLLRIAFPGWRDSEIGRAQTATPAHNEGGWGTGGPLRVLVEPKLVLRTGADRFTLIAGMVPADDDDKPDVAHPTPMGLSAYQFQRSGERWMLVGRQEGFDYQGFFGDASLRTVRLSARVQGIGVEVGSCWQGYCGSWMALYELEDGKVKPDPIGNIGLSGKNIDSVPDCPQRLRPLIASRPEDDIRDEEPQPESHNCYAIESTWSIASSDAQPGDVTIHYRGAMSRAAKKPGPPAAIDQRQMLRYRDGKYQVISGEDPLPGI